jgi:hypothetical protein
MRPTTSPAAVLNSLPGPRSANRPESSAAGRLSSRERPRVSEGLGATTGALADSDEAPGRLLTAIVSLGEIVLIAYAVPLVILAIGAPIALLVRLGMWIVAL